MKRSVIYIDGLNLYYGMLKDTPYKWLDLERFFRLLRQDDDIQRVYYFTTKIAGPGAENQERYLRALATLPRVRIILGKFKRKSIQCKVADCRFRGRRRFDVTEEKRPAGAPYSAQPRRARSRRRSPVNQSLNWAAGVW